MNYLQKGPMYVLHFIFWVTDMRSVVMLTKLSQGICNSKYSTNVGKNPGVCKLYCPPCDSLYIGQMGRNFKLRYKGIVDP